MKTTLWMALAVVIPATANGQAGSPLYYEDPKFVWMDNRDPESPRPSPNAVTGLQIGSTRVMIAYGRPGVQGRKIFGGLVPYGIVWRTGADEVPTITTTGPILIAGHELPAGTYSLFTRPGVDTWEVLVHPEANRWGERGVREEDMVLRFEVPAEETPLKERMEFGFDRIDPDRFSARLYLHWATTRIGFTVVEP